MTTTELKDYSQFGEQHKILAALGDEPGRFLDIGAWVPTHFSNTRALYELGWSGVLVEPSPEPFLALLKEYGNDDRIELVHAAVGFEHCLIPFHATADAVSTSNAEVHELWKDIGGYYGRFHAPQITLEEIANQFGGFQFVNIDAEGQSVHIFHRMIEIGWLPKCICVEHDSRSIEIQQVAQERGYVTTLTNGTNLVLARAA